jgi:hypothetical protein
VLSNGTLPVPPEACAWPLPGGGGVSARKFSYKQNFKLFKNIFYVSPQRRCLCTEKALGIMVDVMVLIFSNSNNFGIFHPAGAHAPLCYKLF